MSGTSFSPRELSRAVDIATAVVCCAMLLVMVQMPAEETLPYHVLFLTLTIVYGYRVWPLTPTLLVVAGVTVSTGAIFLSRWHDSVIDDAELFEVPLMPALLLAMVWHARRRASAEMASRAMADELQVVLERERAFLSDTSHAIRTPVTIARGHVDLLVPELDGLALEDANVVLRQLSRMERLSGRLLALAHLESGSSINLQPLDVGAFVGEIAVDWRPVDRDWVVEVQSGDIALADAEWLHLALDALVENALKFTDPGKAVAITCDTRGADLLVSVEDSGPGVPPEDRRKVFDRFWHRNAEGRAPGSGLGLAMVRAVADAHAGRAEVDESRWGGARFSIALPLVRRRVPAPEHARV